ncbi:hypothetical protein HYU13_03280 [Candidatus Woesearchaeota archaeon]|nr:hypothetical protein [Candidatus Woesearchaeota archaeon]
MSSFRLIVDHLKLDYSGTFDFKGLIRVINAWAFEKDMEKNENKANEIETPDGRQIEYENQVTKRLSDYTIFCLKMRILGKNLKKVELVKDKRKMKVDRGRILFFLDGFLQTDSESKWEDRPLLIFLRTMFDKFIYKLYTDRFERQLTRDCYELFHLVERFLNMQSLPKAPSHSPGH